MIGANQSGGERESIRNYGARFQPLSLSGDEARLPAVVFGPANGCCRGACDLRFGLRIAVTWGLHADCSDAFAIVILKEGGHSWRDIFSVEAVDAVPSQTLAVLHSHDDQDVEAGQRWDVPFSTLPAA